MTGSPTPAQEAARNLGIPDTLFIGLCEWLESNPVGTAENSVSVRFDPNTRARALQACRTLVGLREHGVIGGRDVR